jgi:glycosyltransferase involved in cell wall biosynthesis
VTRVHLVYPHADRISCPDAIGRHLARRLRERYDIKQYNWDETDVIEPEPGDVLVGHPHPARWTIFRRSQRLPAWARVVGLSPYHHGELRQVAFLDPIIRRCDLYLAITGNYWASCLTTPATTHWRPKLVPIDLAIDRSEFPALKQAFNPAGARRFLYIGHSHWMKNTRYLSAISRLMRDTQFGWIGTGEPISEVVAYGYRDFREDPARRLVAEHDFLLTVGAADANPATVLEAMAWGLIPVCTPQSGYVGYPGIVNIPLGDAARAATVLEELQRTPEERLFRMQRLNWRALEEKFTWDRFAADVTSAIESAESPPIHAPRRTAISLWWSSITSPYAGYRRANLQLLARRLGQGSRSSRSSTIERV